MNRRKLKRKKNKTSQLQRRDRPPEEAFAIVTHIFSQLSVKERTVIEEMTESSRIAGLNMDRAVMLLLDAMTVRQFWGDKSFPMIVSGKAEMEWMTKLSELMRTQEIDVEEAVRICLAIIQALVHSDVGLQSEKAKLAQGRASGN